MNLSLERRNITFQLDIADLQKHLDNIHSIAEMRSKLLERDLRLVVSIYTRGVHCLDWNITEKKMAGILQLDFLAKLTRLSAEDISIESNVLYPVTFGQKGWLDQDALFEIFKQGIKNCVKCIRRVGA